MVTISATIALLVVVPLSLLRIARRRRRRQPTSLALNSLGAVSPRWLIEHRH